MLVVIILLIVVASPSSSQRQQPPSSVPATATRQKIDCYPDSKLPTQHQCLQRNCVFDDSGVCRSRGEPCCYFDLSHQGYRVRSTEDTVRGFRAHLQVNVAEGPFPGLIQRVLVEVTALSDDILRISFDDEDNPVRFKVPVPLTLPQGQPPSNRKYRVDVTDQGVFAFQVVRVSTNTTVWDTGVGGLVLSDQYLQLATRLPSGNVYGLGENLHDSFRHDLNATWPAFARDQPPSFSSFENLYGVHPFYTCLEDQQGNSHGALLLNSNAQDFSLSPLPMLTYRTTGGILDFYFFFGPSPEQVIQQYTATIGRPMMPPYWSLGFQLSRYGYNHLGELRAAVETTQRYGIPLDVQYADIDYMDERRDFTVDPVNFHGLNEYFLQLHASGMKTIIMLDPALVSNYSNYEAYDVINAVDGFVKWPNDISPPEGSSSQNNAILGYVWPTGKTAFPDFFKNNTRQAWQDLIVKLHRNLSFDGLWIDMNEPACFGTNEDRPFNWPEDVRPYWSLKCPNTTWDDPPYRTKAAYLHDSNERQGRLSDKTICLSAVHGDANQYRHYDVHNLYGYSETTITSQAVRVATGERSVVISRSTFPGSGKYAGHWLGDNQSKWSDLRHSVIGILEFNLFGIPYIGADICGFFGDATAELCLRWMQLGAFYTFSRNHNTIGTKRQDPGYFGEEVARASREILETRYWLLPYLYTLFHEAHTQGGTVIRPLHHEFSTDPATYSIDTQFLWGPALMIAPILEEGQKSMTFYVPDGPWYDFYSGRLVTGPHYVTVAVRLDSKPVVLVRGGHVLPLQQPAANTALSRKNPLKLLIALDRNYSAAGSLFWDDGVSVDTFQSGQYYLAEYNATQTSLTVRVTHNNVAETSTLHFSDLEIWGLGPKLRVHDVIVRDSHGAVQWRWEWDHDPQAGILKLFHMRAALSESFTVTWRTVNEAAASRVDCWPERQGGVDLPTELKCHDRNCIWSTHPDPAIPDCYFPLTNYGYRQDASGWQTLPNGRQQVTLNRIAPGLFTGTYDSIVFSLEEYGDNVVRFKFDSPTPGRYTVPVSLNLPQAPARNPQYRFKINSGQAFTFSIIRNSTGEELINTRGGALVYHDQFLQFSTHLNTRNVYGMGENIHPTFRRDLWYKTYAFFGRDQPTKTDETLTHYYNHYGTHPFLHVVENDGQAHGILFFNSNPQDYTFNPTPMITYRTIGGILDFYLILGTSPEHVIQQYTQMIGLPYMPPYWSLGFQLCKYGYNSLDALKAAVDRTKAAGIPQDVQYADIDHMSERRDFTLDNSSFPALPEYFRQLREGGMRTIIILDPALVSNYSNYEPYERMKAVSGFIKWPQTPGYLYPQDAADTDHSILGYVWPSGKTVFPDFFKTEVQRVWKELIVEHRARIAFDGLWIDMNEPAVFGTNEDRPFNWPEEVRPHWSLKCPLSKLDDPPYRTGAGFNFDTPTRHGRLSDKTICMTAVQGQHDEYRHYDVHNLYGWSQTLPTLEGLRTATGERGIVVSRSTFVGSGHYAGHWLGDNLSSWGDLRASIVGILEFNLFGFPYTGADICGHFDNVSAELCKRWMQLGAFYTFSRNHNAIGNRDQDPGSFDEEVSRVSREAMETRYWLLPYVYTLFHQVHTKGGTVIRPLHHEFPTDPVALGCSEQFMWGSYLLISPVLYPNMTSLTYYVPKGSWYDFNDAGRLVTSEGGQERTVEVRSDSRTELLVRGGGIIPMQAPALNTSYSRRNPFTLLVALDNTQGPILASGQLFWDDGVSVDTFQDGSYYLAEYVAEANTLNVTVTHNNVAEIQNLFYNTIRVYGIRDRVVDVEPLGLSSTSVQLSWTYDASLQTLTINNDNHVLALATSFAIRWRTMTDEDLSRVDCWPERQGGVDVPDQGKCLNRNCVWLPHWHPNVPACFFPKANFGYRIDGQFYADGQGQSARLTRLGSGPFANDWTNVVFTVEEHGNDVLRFKFTTADGRRYVVPKQLTLDTRPPTDPKYEFQVISLNPFAFRIIRKSTKAILFDTSVGGLVLEEQFLQLSTRLCSPSVYGLGENIHKTFKRDLWYHTYPIFGRDQGTSASSTLQNHYNHYGTHPFYECVEDDGSTHGVLLLNSNAQDYSFTPLPMLTYRTIGGILDFYIFLGPNPEEVVQQYTGTVGRPYMPPYWGLGFQLCKYGYNSLEALKTAVDRTKAAGIPHDIQYADIDHMDERRDFTMDQTNFGGLAQYFQQLRQDGMRTIIILDPALVSNYTGYEPYDRLKAVGGFIKWPNDTGYPVPDESADTDQSILGYVWPRGKTVFPDFFKANVQDEWKKLIVEHRSRLAFDGLWIDMNEPAVFGTNEERPFNWPEEARPYWSLKCPVSKLDDPPYRTAAAYSYDSASRRGRLSDKTLCLTAVQGQHDEYRLYDVHNLYGWSQTLPTLEAMRQAAPLERGLVVTRSTFVGSGQHAGHWLGDNESGWADLRASIVGILDFNLFGFTYTGADICGHFGQTTAELCKRWMQLGAFYTFSRNHNAIGNRDQDPGNFDAEVSRVSREAMETRYWLLPYLYTLLHEAHVRGGTVLRPVHHEFSTDRQALDVNEQFMWGSALHIAPILYQNATSLSFYLPEGRWYDFYQGTLVTSTGKVWQTIPVQSDTPVQLSVRGGYVIPLQEPARNTTYSRKNPMKLIVALNAEDTRGGSAQGTLFWDDGVSIDTYENGNYYQADFVAANKSLTMTVRRNHAVPEVARLKFNLVEVWGIARPDAQLSVTVSGDMLSPSEFSYLPASQVLKVTRQLPVNQDFTITWI